MKLLESALSRLEKAFEKTGRFFRWLTVGFVLTAAGLWALAVAAQHLPHYYWWDHSIPFMGAVLWDQGYEPYVDFGVPTGLGCYWLTRCAFWIAGRQMLSLLIWQSILHLLAALSLYDLFRILYPKSRLPFFVALLVLAGTTVPVIRSSFYNSDYQVFAYFSVLALLRSCRGNGYRLLWALAGGLSLFVVSQVKQDAGAMSLATCLGLAVYLPLFLKRRTYWPPFFGVFAGAWAVFLWQVDWEGFSYWFYWGAPHQVDREALDRLANGYKTSLAAYRLTYTIIYYCAALLFFWAVQRPRWDDAGFWLPTVCTLAFCAQNLVTLNLSLFPHMHYALPLVYADLAGKAMRLAGSSRPLTAQALALCVALVYTQTLYVKFGFLNEGWKYVSGEIGPAGISTMAASGPDCEYSTADYLGVYPERECRSTNEGMRTLLTILDSARAANEGNSFKILNMTQFALTLRYPDSHVRGMPLWFDPDVLFMEREQRRVFSMMRSGELNALAIWGEFDYRAHNMVRDSAQRYMRPRHTVYQYEGKPWVRLYLKK